MFWFLLVVSGVCASQEIWNVLVGVCLVLLVCVGREIEGEAARENGYLRN